MSELPHSHVCRNADKWLIIINFTDNCTERRSLCKAEELMVVSVPAQSKISAEQVSSSTDTYRSFDLSQSWENQYVLSGCVLCV